MIRQYQNGCFKNLLKMKYKKLYNPKPLKQKARDNIKLDGKQLNKELAKKMINPYYFTDRKLKVGLKSLWKVIILIMPILN